MDKVEKIIEDKLEMLDNGRTIGNLKDRTLNLKLRPNSTNQSNKNRMNEDIFDIQAQKDILKEEISQMKLEMLRELRDIKQTMKDGNDTNLEMIREMKEMNRNLMA